ncbi:MAG: class I SAM-dependent RNA methyltransferase [Bacillota bacterium]
MKMVELIATAPMGLEAVVAREVKALGYENVKVENGRVLIKADLAAIPRLNLWLRTADRLLIKMGEFKATSFDHLFEGTKKLDWEQWLTKDGFFHVNGRSWKSQLTSVPACQGIVKKAIIEKLKEKYHEDWFSETGAKFPIEVALQKDIATLTLDTSGIGLHKRGYRRLTATAPIKETLAAALVLLSRWEPHRPFLDPLCGSGTIPIEAALIGRNIAPGLKRSFAAENWPAIPQRIWDKAREEGKDLAKREQKLDILASDQDAEAISLAGYHLRQAGVADGVKLKSQALRDIKISKEYGALITNPPYGERLGEISLVEQLYKEMGELSRQLATWSFFVITSYPGFEGLFGRTSDKNRKLYNGRIETKFYQYLGPLPPRTKKEE